MLQQLYTYRHDKVCRVTTGTSAKILISQFQKTHGNMNQKRSLKSKEVMLTYDLMIPSSMIRANKALWQDIVLVYKSIYTLEYVKAWETLDAYNWLNSGWISNVAAVLVKHLNGSHFLWTFFVSEPTIFIETSWNLAYIYKNTLRRQ